MLYPLSYERSHCSILHSEPARRVLEIRTRHYSGARASWIFSGLKPRNPSARSAGLASAHGLFRLYPANQVLPADRFQQRRMVGGHVAPDHPDHLIIAIAAGHEPAFAPDQLHPRASSPGCITQRNATMLG
jgi:hypothetical protein